MSARATPKPCPICGTPAAASYAPFCSRGCKDRDLLRWLGEGYRVPGAPLDPGEQDGLDTTRTRD